MGGRRGGRGNVGARKRKEKKTFLAGFKGVESNLLKVAKFLKKNNK